MHDFQHVAVAQRYIGQRRARRDFAIALYRDLGRVEFKLDDKIGDAAVSGDAARLAIEDQVVQPCEEASPTKWHLGHTTWFFERFVLRARQRSYRPVDDRYEWLFNSYYQTVGPMHPRPHRGMLSRPTVAQIHDYRSRIDDAVLELLESESDDSGLSDLIELGLNHEEQHQELLLTDAKQVLFANALEVAYDPTAIAPRGSTTLDR